MRRHLLFLFLFLLLPVISLFAQDIHSAAAGSELDAQRAITTFPYFQDFEGTTFPPNEWLLFDQGGTASSWSANTTHNHTDAGSRSVMHLAGDPLFEEDGWLVIPDVQIPAAGGWTLSFWSLNENPELYENNINFNQVLVSTTTADPASGNYNGIWSPVTVCGNWHFNQVDLSPFSGQTIQVAFRYLGTSAHSWYLDDVRILENEGIQEFPWLEDFESGVFPPYYWFCFDADGNNQCWSWDLEQNHSPGGTASAVHYGGPGNDGWEGGWLITPAIQVPGPGYSLSFRAYNENIGSFGCNQILVSTTVSDPLVGWYEELNFNPVPMGDGWYHYEFDLSGLAGETI